MQHNSYLYRWLRASLQVSTFLGMAMIGLLWTGLTFHLGVEEKNAFQVATQNSGNLARVLEAHVIRTVEGADNVLRSLRAAYAKDPEQFDIENARTYLGEMILLIGVIGPDGFLKATTIALAPGVRVDLSKQEHFRVHVDSEKDDLFISKPVIGTLSGKPSIQLSRRIRNPDGSFGGVIVVSIDQSYMSRLYDSIDVGNDANIMVLGVDGIIRAARGALDVRSDRSSTLLFKKLQESPTGFFDTQGSNGGVKRFVSYRKLESLPLVVSVGLAQDEVFAAYWGNRRAYYTGAAILTVAILIAIGAGIAKNRKLASATSSLRRSTIFLETALENMAHGLCMFDRNQRLIVCNRRYGELYGLTPEQTMPGTTLRAILEARVAAGQTPADAQRYIECRLEEVSRSDPNYVVNELNDGRIFAVSHRPMQKGGWVAIHEDITDIRAAEGRAEAATRELVTQRHAMDQAVMVTIADAEGRITFANNKFCRSSGYPAEEVLGANHRIFASGVHSVEFYRSLYKRITSGEVWRGEVCNKAKDSSLYWVDTTIVPQLGPNGKPIAFMAIRIDVTARKLAETQVAYLARHDALTGIANRAVLQEKIEEAVARLRQQGEAFTIFILDLDGFKHINDTLGHAAGDDLLKQLAHRLKSSLRDTEILARLGGDEFAIIQSGEENQREGAIGLAIRLLEIVSKPFDLDGHNVTIGTSIGIALAPENGIDSGELLKKADLALYRVKSEGRNGFTFFDAEMSGNAAARVELLNDMRGALSRNEFELHYQPVFEAKTGRPCGVEALVRWRHPVEGLIFPDRFIWLAEETGLMEPLGDWILERACTDAVTWPEAIKVAVNLSATQFRSGKLFDVILCALVESGLPPQRLELEITESVLLQNKESYGIVIHQLKNIGISIVLDDFGTGYSSLSYLTMFPFDKIKIDKSFTKGLTNRADCAAVVASVLTLARSLDMAVTAEGVETEQQFELLRTAGVNQVQGYLLGRPRPVGELSFAALEWMGQTDEAA